jgi:hypothetical protein
MVHRPGRLLSFLNSHPDQLHLHSGQSSEIITVAETTDIKKRTISHAHFLQIVDKIITKYADSIQSDNQADPEGYYGKTIIHFTLDAAGVDESKVTHQFSITKHPGNLTFSERVTKLIPGFIKNNPLATTSLVITLLAVGIGGYHHETSLSLGNYAWSCVSSISGVSQCLSDATTYASRLKTTLIG